MSRYRIRVRNPDGRWWFFCHVSNAYGETQGWADPATDPTACAVDFDKFEAFIKARRVFNDVPWAFGIEVIEVNE